MGSGRYLLCPEGVEALLAWVEDGDKQEAEARERYLRAKRSLEQAHRALEEWKRSEEGVKEAKTYGLRYAESILDEL